MWTATFWKASIERALKTVAQALLLFFGADGFDWLDLDAGRIGAIIAGAAVTSLLTSIASSGFGPQNSPSLVVDTRNDVAPDAA